MWPRNGSSSCLENGQQRRECPPNNRTLLHCSTLPTRNREWHKRCEARVGTRGRGMKLVIAIIKPFKLDEVREALRELCV